MRKLIVSNLVSLDGYYTGPGNNVMVLPLDEAFDAYNAERLRAAVGGHENLPVDGQKCPHWRP